MRLPETDDIAFGQSGRLPGTRRRLNVGSLARSGSHAPGHMQTFVSLPVTRQSDLPS